MGRRWHLLLSVFGYRLLDVQFDDIVTDDGYEVVDDEDDDGDDDPDDEPEPDPGPPPAGAIRLTVPAPEPAACGTEPAPTADDLTIRIPPEGFRIRNLSGLGHACPLPEPSRIERGHAWLCAGCGRTYRRIGDGVHLPAGWLRD